MIYMLGYSMITLDNLGYHMISKDMYGYPPGMLLANCETLPPHGLDDNGQNTNPKVATSSAVSAVRLPTRLLDTRVHTRGPGVTCQRALAHLATEPPQRLVTLKNCK
jgi:hypothetical protein